ncbi:MAG: radical SAM protein [Omnitrophica bacterium]|nr:radical SAM protein [Candidatus Omnitrophota bacterium]
MTKRRYKHVYGPVFSWRLGRSLGIDPVYTGRGKVCPFDCVYCQAGRTRVLTGKRKVFVPTDEILEEVKSLPPVKIDYITFSGAGEPTLAENLGEIIKKVRKIRKAKIAVLTNSALLGVAGVRSDLLLADFVAVKLDAHSDGIFHKINAPEKQLKLKNIIKWIRKFKARYKGKFALQIMFTARNKKYARELAKIARSIGPDEVHINTPRRPCRVKALPKKEIEKINGFFKDMNVKCVYDAKRKKTKSLKISGALRRKGSI